jgi:hypothetical protein
MNKITFTILAIAMTQMIFSCKSKPIAPTTATKVEPTVDREIYRKAVRTKENQNNFIACYKSLAERQPQAEGRLVFDFEIDDNSHIIKLTIDNEKSTLIEEQFSICMITEASKIKFPPAPKDTIVEVKYPFILQKKK